MKINDKVKGIFAAAISPMDDTGHLILKDILPYLQFLADRGCHGCLLFGTAGEGTSLSSGEKILFLEEAVKINREYPEFSLIVGTGSPSLTETIELTKKAFEYSIDGVLVLPPYYYRGVSEDGVVDWFERVISEAVPQDGFLFGYNFPRMTGIPLSMNILRKLNVVYPEQFAGIKDSSGDTELPIIMKNEFGDSMSVLVGNDRILTRSLKNNGDGCITALANVCSPLSRRIWENNMRKVEDDTQQSKLDRARLLIEENLPTPVMVKYLLKELFGFPDWNVRAPLMHFEEDRIEKLKQESRYLLSI